MGREIERQTLEVHLASIWKPEYGPLAWPNVDFNTPANSRWASATIMTYPTERASLGSSEFLNRHHGSLQIDLYTPAGQGTVDNREAADFLESHFDSLLLSCPDGSVLTFQTPYSFEPSGAAERQDGTNENWSRRIVDIPFHHDVRMIK